MAIGDKWAITCIYDDGAMWRIIETVKYEGDDEYYQEGAWNGEELNDTSTFAYSYLEIAHQSDFHPMTVMSANEPREPIRVVCERYVDER